MSDLVSNLYKKAKDDQVFKDEFLKSEKNYFPFWADTLEKAIISSCYYGFLIGKYSVEHAEKVKGECK